MRLRPSPLHKRSRWRQALPGWRSTRAIVLAALACAALLAVRPWLEQAWQRVLLHWVQALGLPVAAAPRPPGGWLLLATPQLSLAQPAPGSMALALHLLAAAAAWWAAGRLPEATRPLRTLLRFAALAHALALLAYAVWPAPGGPSVDVHACVLLRQLWGMMLALPLLHALSRGLLPMPLSRRLGLLLLSLAWMALLAPCLAATHVALAVLLGPPVLPLLALLGGAVPVLAGLVALHAWALAAPHAPGCTFRCRSC